jgi:hypothetical protein
VPGRGVGRQSVRLLDGRPRVARVDGWARPGPGTDRPRRVVLPPHLASTRNASDRPCPGGARLSSVGNLVDSSCLPSRHRSRAEPGARVVDTGDPHGDESSGPRPQPDSNRRAPAAAVAHAGPGGGVRPRRHGTRSRVRLALRRLQACESRHRQAWLRAGRPRGAAPGRAGGRGPLLADLHARPGSVPRSFPTGSPSAGALARCVPRVLPDPGAGRGVRPATVFTDNSATYLGPDEKAPPK